MSEDIYLSMLKFIEAALQFRHSSEFSKLCVNVTAGSGILLDVMNCLMLLRLQ